MVTDEEFAPDFIDAVSAGEVAGWRHLSVTDPVLGIVKVLINEAGPVLQGWMLSPAAQPLFPGFVVGRGVNVVKG